MMFEFNQEGATLFPMNPEWFLQYVRRSIREELESIQSTTSTTEPSSHTDLLTAKETCIFLDVTRKTLRDWEKQGRLMPVRIGRRVYYRRSDIEKALSGGTR